MIECRQNGSAYVMVIVTCFLVLTLALTVLTVTAASRNVTGRYGDFYGLYDVAAAGNEQAFFDIEAAYASALARNPDAGSPDFYEIFVEELENYFLRNGFKFIREWGLGINYSGLPGGGQIQDDFSAVTTVSVPNNFFVGETEIETRVFRLFDGTTSSVTVARSYVKFLDDDRVEMVELFRE